ncbi:MAG: amidohydrolase, partial [Kangiellaceae bacterium]|nr:amidohydrolase [Kangiellaceae bacterium]
FSQLWDCHFHLVGNGLNPAIDGKTSGIWLSPNMTKWSNFTQRIQYAFYLNAGCIEQAEFADNEYVTRSIELLNYLPAGIRLMLLAFDYFHNDKGEAEQQNSTFYVPNEFAARMAKVNSGFEWIGSVHPYRKDALEQLEWCAQNGAKAIKWLPPAMNIDPSSSRCNRFYEKLEQLNLPLLTHAGEEKAVHSEKLQKLANPLFLRKPLELGVKVIVAHCASLGTSQDIETNSAKQVSNFELFARLMNQSQYENNLMADISAVNLFNREITEIKQIVRNQHWHKRLLYASDYPLPGVMPIISSTNLASHGLIDQKLVPFLNQVRQHNSWLYDFLIKRFLRADSMAFTKDVFHTARHFN